MLKPSAYIISGILTIFVLWWFTPLLDLLEIAFYLLFVPVMFCAAIGLISVGTYDVAKMAFGGWIKDLRYKVEFYRDIMEEEQLAKEARESVRNSK